MLLGQAFNIKRHYDPLLQTCHSANTETKFKLAAVTH